MKEVEKIFLLLWNLVIFVGMSILFLPAFLIVTYIQPLWSKKLEELFGF